MEPMPVTNNNSKNSSKNVPKNVFYFEVLLYASLTLDALSIAFQDRTADADLSESTMMAANIVAACLLLLFVFLVSHAAHGRKSWPRWVLVASLVFSVLSLTQILGVNGLQLDSAIEIVSCALTAAGLYFGFTGDAKDWFNA
jgi:protein-S-isoprenylcysteine O-methyltransferase Ste14